MKTKYKKGDILVRKDFKDWYLEVLAVDEKNQLILADWFLPLDNRRTFYRESRDWYTFAELESAKWVCGKKPKLPDPKPPVVTEATAKKYPFLHKLIEALP